MKRIGIFGGTFDPIHNGHLNLAATAREQLSLDSVLFITAGTPWQKQGRVVTPARDRFLMVKRAVWDIRWAQASNIEVDNTEPTYTIDTLRELQSPDSDLFLLMGSDQAENLHTWKDADLIPQYATIHVVDRWLNLSATLIRERLAQGLSISGLVPQVVLDTILEYKLYQ